MHLFQYWLLLVVLLGVTACDPECAVKGLINDTKPFLLTSSNPQATNPEEPLKGQFIYDDTSCLKMSITRGGVTLTGACVGAAVPYTDAPKLSFAVNIPAKDSLTNTAQTPIYSQVILKGIDNKPMIKCALVHLTPVSWYQGFKVYGGRCFDINSGQGFDIAIPPSCSEH